MTLGPRTKMVPQRRCGSRRPASSRISRLCPGNTAPQLTKRLTLTVCASAICATR